MVNTKIIRNKIISITNTQKITRTMEMIAISKMKKMKQKLLIGAPYLKNIMKIISHFFHGKLKYQHCFLKKRSQIKKILIIIISSNRGLCGNLNYNVFKNLTSLINSYKNKNIDYDLYCLGTKGLLFCNQNYDFHVKKFINFNDNITHDALLPLITKIIQKYQLGKFDKLFVIGNCIISNYKYKPYTLQILPLKSNIFHDVGYTKYVIWDYIYEPNAQVVLDYTMNQYILLQLFQLVLENMVCEQSARMFAMKTATDNSENIMQELKLIYNKIRQYSITQEILEIISGSSIVN